MPYWLPKDQKKLGVPDANVRLGFIVQHGGKRNADAYTRAAIMGVRRASLSAEEVMVIGPQVYFSSDSELDTAADELWWTDLLSSSNKRNNTMSYLPWYWGGGSGNTGKGPSMFEVFDDVMTTLFDRTLYPRLERIIIIGHSAGAQLVQRYAIFSSLAHTFPIEYYVANPSSLAYLDQTRPVLFPVPHSCLLYNPQLVIHHRYSFRIPSAASTTCLSTYNSYGYGIDGDLVPKTGSALREALISYVHRHVFYLAGAADNCNEHNKISKFECCRDGTSSVETQIEVGLEKHLFDDRGLDKSCEAVLQGRYRFERLHAFVEHVQLFARGHAPFLHRHPERNIATEDANDAATIGDSFTNVSERHRVVTVEGVGHSGCGMLQSPEFAALIRLTAA